MGKSEELDERAYEEKYLKDTIEICKEEIENCENRASTLYTDFDPRADDPYVVEQLIKMYDKTAVALRKALKVPYFARIDFVENGKEGEEKPELYIGKCSVLKNSGRIQVIDWRAPVSSLYYDGRLGEVSYESPEGIVQGLLTLKRLFDITEGKLNSFSDIDITANDELLKPYLSASSDNRLKNIISTIQQEQNKIIRAKLRNPIIVQGVAGSGKTTVALHRIAYLAYTYEKTLKPEEFLIIAPNKFFLDYISAILPDLGVDDVKQLTFEQFATEMIGTKIKVENSNNKIAEIVNNHKGEDTIEQRTARFKSSLKYKEILDRYLAKNGLDFLPNEDLKIGDVVILTQEKIRERYDSQYFIASTPMEERYKIFMTKLGAFIANNREGIDKLLVQCRTEELSKIDQEREREKKFAIYNKYDELRKLLDKNGKALLAKYSKKGGKKVAINVYRDFVARLEEYSQGEIPEDILHQIQSDLLDTPTIKEIQYEDLAPLMYIENQINGSNYAKSAKCIVIDEAQDYSEFQMAALKEILHNNSLTILGDIAQGIYSYRGINDWERVNREVFGGQAEVYELSKSYRTTMEIMEKGNDVIDKIRDQINVKLGEPVIRRGTPVAIERKDKKTLGNTIATRIEELLKENRKNIAVITKTLQEAVKLDKELKAHNIASNLISEKATEYIGGVTVIPSYLSKGLEFDSVILSDASQSQYGNSELDAKLLYISITRAMHTLDIYYTGERSMLLEDRKQERNDGRNIIDLDERGE